MKKFGQVGLSWGDPGLSASFAVNLLAKGPKPSGPHELFFIIRKTLYVIWINDILQFNFIQVSLYISA